MPKRVIFPLMMAYGLLAGSSGSVYAQLGGTLALDSDYRFRGSSFSDGKPSLRAGATYDDADGWYAGGALARVNLATEGHEGQALLYLGQTLHAAEGRVGEVGLLATHYTHSSRYDYQEFYVGFLAERGNVRIYYSPRYFGHPVQTAYLEFNGGIPLTRELNLFGHLGWLGRVGGQAASDGWRHDQRLGLALRRSGWEWQLAYSSSHGQGPLPAYYEASRRAWVSTLARYF